MNYFTWTPNSRTEFEVDGRTDIDGEVSFYFERDFDSKSWYMPVEDVRQLRDHLTAVLRDHDARTAK